MNQTATVNKTSLSRLNQLLMGLVLIQIALVAWAFWPQGSGGGATAPLLPDLTVSAVNQLTVTDTNDNEVTLVKEHEGWVVADTDQFPATTTTVEELLEKLTTIESDRLVTRTSGSHKRLQVADDDFARRLELQTTEGDYTLYVGSSPSAGATHVRLAGQDETYLTSEVSSWELNTQTSSWIDTLYVDLSSDNVTTFTLENDNDVFNFEKDATGAWTLSDLATDETINPAQITSLLNHVVNVRMTEPLGKTAQDSYGLTNPQATITLQLSEEGGSSNITTLTLGAKDEGDGSYVFKASTADYYVTIASFTGDELINKTRDDFLSQPTPEIEGVTPLN